MSNPKESAITKSILNALNKLDGCRAIKVYGGGMGRQGQPDITGCIHGRRFDLEVKRPGEKPTALQVKEMASWLAVGSVVAVVHSKEEALSVVQGWHDTWMRADSTTAKTT